MTETKTQFWPEISKIIKKSQHKPVKISIGLSLNIETTKKKNIETTKKKVSVSVSTLRLAKQVSVSVSILRPL